MDSITLLKEDVATLFVGDGIYTFIFFGILLSVLYDIVTTLTSYINNKTWLVNDYERIIYNIENCTVPSEEDDKIYHDAVYNYKKYLKFKKKRDDFINKIKSFFKR